jgi:DNA-directed RNA polymerase specialized sigma24 family protein
VFLKHFADLTFKEIGRVTGVPTFTASSRYGAAMRRLRAGMEVPR